MSEQDDVPDPELMAALLRQRYPLAAGDSVEVQVETAPKPKACLTVTRAAKRHRPPKQYTIDVVLTAAGSWSHLVDAVDALFGQLVEADYAHRKLPCGADLELGSARFDVTIDCKRPDLDAAADQLLSAN